MQQFSFARWSLLAAGIILVGTLSLYLIFLQSTSMLSEDFNYHANILSYDNFYDSLKNDFSGEILSKTKYSYRVESANDKAIIIRNIFDVRKPSGEPIFKVERLYGIDPVTGRHVAGYGDKDRDGYLFAPKNPGREFIYWHTNYDMPATMKLRAKEKIEGLHVYRYECNYKADQTENLTGLPGVSKSRGIEVDVNLQLWIEPSTGYLINYKDSATAWYYDLKTKKRIRPWNKFHNEFEETSISKQIQVVLIAKERSIWQNRYLPLSNFVLILIVLSLTFPESKQVYRRYIASGLILLVGLAAALLLYLSLKKATDVRSETIFTRECESVRTSMQRELERCADVLNAIKINYVSLKKMDRDQFRSIATLSLRNNESITGIGWIPIVRGSQRDSLEKNAQSELPDFHLTEIKNGERLPANERASYFPLYYIEPFENNKSLVGFDLGSDESRKIAIEKAAATREATATASIEYQGDSTKRFFLILLPVYKNELGLGSSQAVHAFLSVRVSINSLVQAALDQATVSNPLNFSITEPTSKDGGTILYSDSKGEKDFTIEKISTLQVANRHWLLKFRSAPSYSPFESALFTSLLPIFTALATIFLSIFIFQLLTENQHLKSPASHQRVSNP